MTKEELIAFETDIANLFEQAKIPYPVHLSKGNEAFLIDIFQDIQPQDWVFSTHRSHYHALLKGISPAWLKEEILKGHSITINNAEYKFFSSAIVGGILPIALGVAMAGERVWAFCGDMAATTGIFHECAQYASGHRLPITFVIEDNGYSVETPTQQVWRPQLQGEEEEGITKYAYQRGYPHQGSGKWVVF